MKTLVRLDAPWPCPRVELLPALWAASETARAMMSIAEKEASTSRSSLFMLFAIN
jgi:citrate lyase beta subunit